MQFCGMLFMIQTFVKTSTDSFLVPLRLISSLAFTTALDEVSMHVIHIQILNPKYNFDFKTLLSFKSHFQACAYEFDGGINFNDLTPNGRGARILYSLIFICFDIVFYGIIALYLDNVIPSKLMSRLFSLMITGINLTDQLI